MSQIRPLTAADLPAVADMFQRLLRRGRGAPPAALIDYLGRLFLTPPDPDPDIVSQVHLRDDGTVSGFIGVFPLPFRAEGVVRRVAVCGTYMVDDRVADPFAGARLLRSFLAGPQDISLTETANDVSTTMWTRLNGVVLPDYSLEWLRVIRPAAFLAQAAGRAVPGAGVLTPLAAPLDALIRRFRARPQWSHMPPTPPGRVLDSAEADEALTAELLARFTRHHPLRPQWPAQSLARMIAESRRKANYGTMVRRVVKARGGEPVGLFLYHGDAGRIGRTLQVVAAPGRTGAVIDSMLADANERGLAALRGRSRPDLLEAMLGRRFAFVHASSSIVHANDPQLLEPFRRGQAFFNGFAGESWSRLIGDTFD